MQKAPATYRVNAIGAANELNYADMVALAETFLQWALEEPEGAPHHRTVLIEVGVDDGPDPDPHDLLITFPSEPMRMWPIRLKSWPAPQWANGEVTGLGRETTKST